MVAWRRRLVPGGRRLRWRRGHDNRQPGRGLAERSRCDAPGRPATRRDPRPGHQRVRRRGSAGRRRGPAAPRDRRARARTVRRADGEAAAAAADSGIAALVAGWPLRSAPRRSPAPSPSTSTWPTWPRSTSGSARCASATPAPRRCASRSRRRWPASARRSATDRRAALLGRLEVHPVLTAHPTEARRRAVTEALRRIGAQLDDARRPAARRSRARRGAAPAAGGDRPAVAHVRAAQPGNAAAG